MVDAAMEEDDMEFDSTAEDLWNHSKEQSRLRLLLPTLLFLLALLRNLQVRMLIINQLNLGDVLDA
jgi:hypothetical protein